MDTVIMANNYIKILSYLHLSVNRENNILIALTELYKFLCHLIILYMKCDGILTILEP